MSGVPLTQGSRFADRYRVERCIAQGGMGAVYEATHVETGRRCALKVMLPEVTQSEGMRERFRQEARVAAQVQSAFIVDILDAGVDEATEMPFLVMELLQGETLRKRLRRVKRMPPEEVVTYLHQIALALDKTHAFSIVHRDLKLDNLFLTEREDGSIRVKLLDFGIAKLIEEGATSTPATRSLGTPLYMAPEQFGPHPKVSPATDIYALGMIAYTLLVGVSYWLEESRGAGVFAFAARAIDGPQELATERARRQEVTLPQAFDAWFAKVAAVNPLERFPTASEAVLALAEALDVPIAQNRLSGLPPLSSRNPPLIEPSSPPSGKTSLPPRVRTSREPEPERSPPSERSVSPGVTGISTPAPRPSQATRGAPAFSARLALLLAAVAVIGLASFPVMRRMRSSIQETPATTPATIPAAPVAAPPPPRSHVEAAPALEAAPTPPAETAAPIETAAPTETAAPVLPPSASAQPALPPSGAASAPWKPPSAGAKATAPAPDRKSVV